MGSSTEFPVPAAHLAISKQRGEARVSYGDNYKHFLKSKFGKRSPESEQKIQLEYFYQFQQKLAYVYFVYYLVSYKFCIQHELEQSKYQICTKMFIAENAATSDNSGQLKIGMNQRMHTNTNGDEIQTKDDGLFDILKESNVGMTYAATWVEI
ncbi:MAG: hypothetical protein EZS28_028895 [Streblomastix strix]|uniref:Uncharacterized protein n=1 Tax=Streblomastix strix TaxID=222440 RepID=A0A5J4UYV6_9EUKA|nr:MAG: hypothetical protein EZS28_028895 [Streblomastix strix]